MQGIVNGRADIVGPPILIGDFFPEKRDVVVNGQKYEGWVTTNRRYPRPIMARLDRYRSIYQAAVAPVLAEPPDTPDISDEERIAKLAIRQANVDAADAAYDVFLTDAIMALVPSLDQGTVEMIDREGIELVLRELGYFAPLLGDDSGGFAQPAQDGGNAEETAPLTGAISTPDSVGSTQPIPSNDS